MSVYFQCCSINSFAVHCQVQTIHHPAKGPEYPRSASLPALFLKVSVIMQLFAAAPGNQIYGYPRHLPQKKYHLCEVPWPWFWDAYPALCLKKASGQMHLPSRLAHISAPFLPVRRTTDYGSDERSPPVLLQMSVFFVSAQTHTEPAACPTHPALPDNPGGDIVLLIAYFSAIPLCYN